MKTDHSAPLEGAGASDSAREAALQPLEAKHYERLVQSVVDYAIFMLDPEGRVASWNPGAERIKGYTAREIIGRHFSEFYTEEDRSARIPWKGLETAAREGRFAAEGWRQRKDGTRFWANVVIDAIRGDHGELIGFAKVTRDMTEQRLAQEAFLESERRFRLLVEGVTDYAIYMLDQEGRVTNWNAGAQRIKGYRSDEIIGRHFSEFYTPEDRELGVPQTALETARREGRYEAEGWRIRKSGDRFWASVVLDAVRDEQGQLIGFAKITRDITERRDAAASLEEVRDQLVQSQKMEALGQLTGGLAHDFNNLLTAIISGAELALRNLNNRDKLEALLKAVLGSAQRGGSLTRQLLAFARRQPLETKLVDLREDLPGIADLLRHSLSADIELVTEISDQILTVEIDPAQLQLAMLNLGFNARDAMQGGGVIRLSASSMRLNGEIDQLTGEFVAITLTDTGAGIAPEIKARIFEPFFTTKSFGHGTGLGLSQVYGFVRQSGGAIRVDSTVGEGTAITLYLPVSGAEVERGSARGPSSGSARILVVEDDTIVAELAVALLAELGYEARVVHSAREALARLAREPGYDLVFSDVIMPGGISGVELARKVRERFPELPVLLTTGYSEKVDHGGLEFPLLSKPYDFDSLEKTLAEVLIGRDRSVGGGGLSAQTTR